MTSTQNDKNKKKSSCNKSEISAWISTGIHAFHLIAFISLFVIIAAIFLKNGMPTTLLVLAIPFYPIIFGAAVIVVMVIYIFISDHIKKKK